MLVFTHVIVKWDGGVVCALQCMMIIIVVDVIITVITVTNIFLDNEAQAGTENTTKEQVNGTSNGNATEEEKKC